MEIKKHFFSAFLYGKYLLAVVLPLVFFFLLFFVYVRSHDRSFFETAPGILFHSQTARSIIYELRFTVPTAGDADKKGEVLLVGRGQDSVRIMLDKKNRPAILFMGPGNSIYKRVLYKELLPGREYKLYVYADVLSRKFVLSEAGGTVLIKKRQLCHFASYTVSIPSKKELLQQNPAVKECRIRLSGKIPVSLVSVCLLFGCTLAVLLLLLLALSFEKGGNEKHRQMAERILKGLICFAVYLAIVGGSYLYRSSSIDVMFLLSLLIIFAPFAFGCCKRICEKGENTFRQHCDRIFFILFSLMLLIPIIFFSFQESSDADKRVLNKMPTLFPVGRRINSNFGREFESYYSDHVGGRDLMLKLARSLKKMVNLPIRESGFWIGKENWFYYTIAEYLNIVDWSVQDKEYITKTLKSIAEFCRKNHIKFYLLICPLKAQIYPEYIPYFQKMRPEKYRLVNILKKELEGIAFIDPTEHLRKLAADKKQALLYYKGDDHCSDWGAYHIYSYAVERIRRDLPQLPSYSFRKEHFKVRGARKHGTLELMHREPDHITQYMENLKIDEYHKRGWPFLTYSENPNALFRLSWYGDSFSFWLLPYMSMGSFKYVFHYPNSSYNVSRGQLLNLKSNVFVLEIWEGHLKNWANQLKFGE